MRISYNWLKEYIDLNIPPERLAEVFTMAGLGVESVEKKGVDHIFEIEITANRPDWLSVIGVARELSAITGRKLKVPIVPKIRTTNNERRTTNDERRTTKVSVENKDLCPRYTARIIRGVKVGESPDWLKAKLEAMGLRSVNNIVDITNFCLFETGEPMHAFDLDKIEGNEIIVRRAKDKEKITVIDGTEKILNASSIVISDSKRAIAIAGVMGALNTEVTASTKNILLEAAFFDPVSVRRTSRGLGISTESSYRFERRVDLDSIEYSSNRTAYLIQKLAGGEIGEFIDLGNKKMGERTVSLTYGRLNSILGLKIKPALAKKILISLGLKAKKSSKAKSSFIIPSFRYDLNSEIDLIEEISRIYGYDKVPATIPDVVEQAEIMSFDMIASAKIRSSLTSFGIDEIITYSLLSKKSLEMALLPTDNAALIKNPLTNEQEAMRTSLLPGMLNTVLWNINRKTKDLKLFELGNIYLKESENKFIERRRLCIGITGDAGGFFELKGVVEALLSELSIEGASYKYAKDKSFNTSECASVEVNGKTIGIIGQIDRKALNNFDIKDKLYVAELDVDSIFKSAILKKRFGGIPKYPSVYRDISIIAAKDTLNSDIANIIKNAAGAILKDTRLIDRYAGEQIPVGKVSLTYRLEYQDQKKTLEEKEVSEAQERILSALEEKLGAKLR